MAELGWCLYCFIYQALKLTLEMKHRMQGILCEAIQLRDTIFTPNGGLSLGVRTCWTWKNILGRKQHFTQFSFNTYFVLVPIIEYIEYKTRVFPQITHSRNITKWKVMSKCSCIPFLDPIWTSSTKKVLLQSFHVVHLQLQRIWHCLVSDQPIHQPPPCFCGQWSLWESCCSLYARSQSTFQDVAPEATGRARGWETSPWKLFMHHFIICSPFTIHFC